MRINSKAFGLLFVAAVFAIQMIVYSQKQPRIAKGNGRGDDGVAYGAVADQILSGKPISGPPPFVYRLGESWIAASYAKIVGVSVDNAFQQTNAMMIILLIIMIYRMTLDFSGPLFAATATVLYILPWWGYSRGIWFYPVLNDVPFVLLTMAGLYLLMWWPNQRASSMWRVFVFGFLCVLAPLTRETGVLLPIVFFASRDFFRKYFSFEVFMGDSFSDSALSVSDTRRELFLSVLFLFFSSVVFFIPRFLIARHGGLVLGGRAYSFAEKMIYFVSVNTIWNFTANVFLAYGGPLLALFVLYHKYWREKMKSMPSMLIYLACIILLTYLGGSQIRYLSWASPLVFMWLAHLAQILWNDAPTPSARFVMRGFLILSFVYYIFMAHPFSGYFNDYRAWQDWGGAYFSSFKSFKYIIPCLGLFLIFIFVGRKMIPNPAGNVSPGSPPYPEP